MNIKICKFLQQIIRSFVSCIYRMFSNVVDVFIGLKSLNTMVSIDQNPKYRYIHFIQMQMANIVQTFVRQF